MQFMIFVLNDTNTFAEEGEQAAIDVFNEKMIADGHWVFAAGLGFPDSAAVFDNRNDRGLQTDGPFAESKEFIAGVWIVQTPDRATAERLAAEGSKACNRRVELRPIFGEGE